MRRFEKWLFRIMTASCGVLCAYILFQLAGMAAENGSLLDAAARFCLPGMAYADTQKGEGLWSVLIRETVPLFFYWKEQEVYIPETDLIEKQEEIKTEESRVERIESETAESETAARQETEEQETEKRDRTEREKVREVNFGMMDDFDYLLNHYFTVDESTIADPLQLSRRALMSPDLSLTEDGTGPQILIYHTHSQEAFADSRPGDVSTTIVGIGDRLTTLLEERYGYQVIHDTSVYDLAEGFLDRNAAYHYALDGISKILDEHPSIQVIIDLHRDGVEGEKFVTEIDGKPTAKIMFFNGLSRSAEYGSIEYLANPYTAENLAFSFQLQVKAEEYYPGLTRNIYLESLRYNLHLRPRSLLVEAGTQLNTVEEEKNAMEPLADILNRVLRGE